MEETRESDIWFRMATRDGIVLKPFKSLEDLMRLSSEMSEMIIRYVQLLNPVGAEERMGEIG